MLPDLQAQLDEVERLKQQYLDELAASDPAEYLFHPEPDAWRWLDIAHHLALTEHVSGKFAGRLLARGNCIPEDAARRGGQLRTLLQSTRRFRVPNGARGVHPDGTATLEDVRRLWEEAGVYWRAVAEAITEDTRDVVTLIHPIAGPLNTRQALDFLADHLRHHRMQVERLRDAYQCHARPAEVSGLEGGGPNRASA